jgi:hypothetical protein
MELNSSRLKNNFHIRVKKTFDDHVIAWMGDFTFVPQEYRDVFLDIAFINLPKSLEIRE